MPVPIAAIARPIATNGPGARTVTATMPARASASAKRCMVRRYVGGARRSKFCAIPRPMSDEIRAGFCAIVGLPNVGKSTLLNRMLARRLVAVSAKPQTTRDRILGVHAITLPGETPDKAQIAYVDTPGVQDGRGPLRRYMRDAAIAAASDADVVLLLVDATDKRGRRPDAFAEAETAALGEAAREHPMVIGLNKVDRVGKPELLPLIEAWSKFAPGIEVVPLSATQGDNVEEL